VTAENGFLDGRDQPDRRGAGILVVASQDVQVSCLSGKRTDGLGELARD